MLLRVAIIAVLLLVIAAGFDIARRRIPNAVSVALFVTGVLAQVTEGGASGALLAIGSGAAVGALLAVAWRRGLIGGGDVKLAAAASVWIGLRHVPVFLAATALAGGATALVWYAISSRRGHRHLRAELVAMGLGLGAPSIAPAGRTVSIPYAVAIAAGAVTAMAWGT